MVFASMFCCVKNSDRKEKGKKQLTWRIFSLKELQSATNNFNYDNKLGEGGFGSVYWGQLWDGSQLDSPCLILILDPNQIFLEYCLSRLSHELDPIINERFMQIAVKRLKVWSNKADMEFAVEVEILARVRHKNLLSLRGYCAEGQERLIVYDYMPNLSLASHLHGQHSAECLLDWKRRVNIAIGSAEGIAELADPKLNGKYDEEELKRVVLVSLVCAHTQPERRPTMPDVIELLKGESKEKLSELENDEMFKAPQAAAAADEEISIAESSSDFISEEKDVNREVEEIVQENTHNS
ncbi:hypothetical protein SADUNF_Sadunf01G0166300 [Salix dunnii]|uniref:Protein kinase domain-containing protein n=1 Tax=Salix dunnii TaxID=1413687 RepID=A0A835NCR9_9ROSI|nr:hypothetical protein SADUNF_Sadunf01G0166300 [Salix dunnii]